jgi:superfamily II DNA or RNA helicase
VIILDTHVRIEDLPADHVLRWMGRATIPNPKYEASARYTKTGKPAAGIKPDIVLAQDTPSGVALPRGFLAEVQQAYPGEPFDDQTVLPAAALATAGTLVPREYQSAAAQAVIDHGGGVVVIPTGQGKTVVALHLVERLQTPALILVHTGVLLAQTAARIREHLGIEPGIIGEGKWKPAPVTVAMVQTLSARGDCGLRDFFGVVVQDEAHHVPAETFAEVVQLFNARYRVGLTATPLRKDGLHPILFSVIGPIVYQMKAKSLPLQFQRVDTGWRPPDDKVPVVEPPGWLLRKMREKGEPPPEARTDYTAMTTMLSASKDRNAVVLDAIMHWHHGTSLVLSERVEHVRLLAAALVERGLRAVPLAGEVDKISRKRTAVSKKERQDAIEGLEAGRYDVLVSTPLMVGEGFDCPRIDTEFVTCPHGDANKATQLSGRCTRPWGEKQYGTVIDFVDADVEPLLRQWWKRLRAYRLLAAPGDG